MRKRIGEKTSEKDGEPATPDDERYSGKEVFESESRGKAPEDNKGVLDDFLRQSSEKDLEKPGRYQDYAKIPARPTYSPYDMSEKNPETTPENKRETPPVKATDFRDYKSERVSGFYPKKHGDPDRHEDKYLKRDRCDFSPLSKEHTGEKPTSLKHSIREVSDYDSKKTPAPTEYEYDSSSHTKTPKPKNAFSGPSISSYPFDEKEKAEIPFSKSPPAKPKKQGGKKNHVTCLAILLVFSLVFAAYVLKDRIDSPPFHALPQQTQSKTDSNELTHHNIPSSYGALYNELEILDDGQILRSCRMQIENSQILWANLTEYRIKPAGEETIITYYGSNPQNSCRCEMEASANPGIYESCSECDISFCEKNMYPGMDEEAFAKKLFEGNDSGGCISKREAGVQYRACMVENDILSIARWQPPKASAWSRQDMDSIACESTIINPGLIGIDCGPYIISLMREQNPHRYMGPEIMQQIELCKAMPDNAECTYLMEVVSTQYVEPDIGEYIRYCRMRPYAADECIRETAMIWDNTLTCMQIQNREMRAQCVTSLALSSKDPGRCLTPDGQTSNLCLGVLAQYLKDPIICDMSSSEAEIHECMQRLSFERLKSSSHFFENPTLCAGYVGDSANQCRMFFAKMSKNPQICLVISSSNQRRDCVEAVVDDPLVLSYFFPESSLA